MKNRTVIGIICIVAAFLLCFFVMPGMAGRSEKDVTAYRAAVRIPRGKQITEADLTEFLTSSDALQNGAVTDKAAILGKYAAAELFAGDVITGEKLMASSDAASDVLYRLEEGEMAVTVAVPSFAGGFSGLLENGDVVKIYVCSNEGAVTVPPELSYLRVITTVTGKGTSRDSVHVGETGTDLPSTIMFAMRTEQVSALLSAEKNGSLQCAFVCHASDKAAAYLAAQKEYLETGDASVLGIGGAEARNSSGIAANGGV